MILGIIIVVCFVLFAFLKDFNKDNQDLEEETITQKFKTIANTINKYAYNGLGKTVPHPNDKRSFHIYQDGAPQIILFEYGTGHLTITWKYKYMGDNEIVHKKIFHNMRNTSYNEQEKIAEGMISEMDKLISEKLKKIQVSPNNQSDFSNSILPNADQSNINQTDKINIEKMQYFNRLILIEYPEGFGEDIIPELRQVLELYIFRDFLALDKKSSEEYKNCRRLPSQSSSYEEYLGNIAKNVQERIKGEVFSFSKKLLAVCLEFSDFSNLKESPANTTLIINNIILNNPLEKDILETLSNNQLDGADNFSKLWYLESLILKFIYSVDQYKH